MEIAKLQDRLTAMVDRSEIKDQRIAELEACIKKELDMAEEWQAMYELLEKVPHCPADVGYSCKDHPDCPACAWAKLKEGK